MGENPGEVNSDDAEQELRVQNGSGALVVLPDLCTVKQPQ